MLSFVASFLLGSKIGRYILAGLAGVAIVSGVLLRAFQKGASYERSKDRERQLQHLQNAAKINAEVSRLPRDSRLDYLNGWVRDAD